MRLGVLPEVKFNCLALKCRQKLVGDFFLHEYIDMSVYAASNPEVLPREV